MDWLSLGLVLLIGTIAYMQTIQGLFNAVVMCVLVLLCAALSLATFEWIALEFLIERIGDLALPAALMGSFIVPLIVLRLTLDSLIKRAGLIPILADRAGAAALGVVTGMTMVGMLAIALQMLPFGGSFMGHSGLDPETFEETGLWLSPDRFVASYAAMLSDGVLSGKNRWVDDHPDWVHEVLGAQAVPPQTRHLVPRGSVRLVHVEYRDYVFNKTVVTSGRRGQPTDAKYERLNPPADTRWLLVRLDLERNAADEDGRHRFARRQLRLVGRDRPGAATRNVLLTAINDNDFPRRAVTIVDGKLYAPHDGSEVDFVFEVPDTFVPMYAEYKVGARVDLSNISPIEDLAPTEEVATDAPAATPTQTVSAERKNAPDSSRPKTGRVSGARGRGAGSVFGDKLPLVMTDYQQFGLDRTGESMVDGHIFGKTAAQGGSGSNAKLVRFEVPADKRLFQLDVEQLRARSLVGRVLSFAVRSVKNYRLRDEAGNVYPVVGQFAIANVGGEEVIEIQYHPAEVEVTGRGGTRDFRRIRDSHLRRGDYRWVYLFLVEPGAKLTEFVTGTGRRATDLKSFNLVAPG